MKIQFQQMNEGFCCMKIQLLTAQGLLLLHEISIPKTDLRHLLCEISATHSEISSSQSLMSALTA
jgi:hypothetical protein